MTDTEVKKFVEGYYSDKEDGKHCELLRQTINK